MEFDPLQRVREGVRLRPTRCSGKGVTQENGVGGGSLFVASAVP